MSAVRMAASDREMSRGNRRFQLLCNGTRFGTALILLLMREVPRLRAATFGPILRLCSTQESHNGKRQARMQLAATETASHASRWTSRIALFSLTIIATALFLHRLFGMPTPVAFNLVLAAYV